MVPEHDPLTVTAEPVREYETVQLADPGAPEQFRLPEPCPCATVSAVPLPLNEHEIAPLPESLTIAPLPVKVTDWFVGVVVRPGEIVPEPATAPDPVEAAAGITPISSANTEIIAASSIARFRVVDCVMLLPLLN